MNTHVKFAIVLGLFCSAVTGAIAADDPIKARQELMKSVGKSTKAMAQMVKGEVPFDAAQAEQAAQTIAGVPPKFVTFFPEGSDTGDTEASPKIWEDMDEFKEHAEKLEADAKSVAEAAGKGEDAFKTAFVALTKNCKSCHEEFRIKKQ